MISSTIGIPGKKYNKVDDDDDDDGGEDNYWMAIKTINRKEEMSIRNVLRTGRIQKNSEYQLQVLQ